MSNTPSSTGIIIVGAGQSQRMGSDKIFSPLAGKPLLAWSVETCESDKLIDKIVIVLNETNIAFGRQLSIDRKWSKVMKICLGGPRRQDSVRQGLQELDDCRWIIIHDAARPFLTTELIDNGLSAARETGAAIAAVPVTDTVKRSDDRGIVIDTLNRSQLWAVQTPQVFRSDIITKAYESMADDVTDDASLVEGLGTNVKVYTGSYNNIKITTPTDLAVADLLVRET